MNALSSAYDGESHSEMPCCSSCSKEPDDQYGFFIYQPTRETRHLLKRACDSQKENQLVKRKKVKLTLLIYCWMFQNRLSCQVNVKTPACSVLIQRLTTWRSMQVEQSGMACLGGEVIVTNDTIRAIASSKDSLKSLRDVEEFPGVLKRFAEPINGVLTAYAKDLSVPEYRKSLSETTNKV